MGVYQYEFQRFGCLLRQKGMTMTDAEGNYICGKPGFVWWWPINWIAVAVYLPIFCAKQLFRSKRA